MFSSMTLHCSGDAEAGGSDEGRATRACTCPVRLSARRGTPEGGCHRVFLFSQVVRHTARAPSVELRLQSSWNTGNSSTQLN